MTQEQYMQLMAQRQQQRGPSPEQQAMMMQQQMMAEQQSAPGAAGGFMGGLLDSALAGLVPNSMYQNPNDPNNVSASKAGGLIGMIIPMLLAKYGIKNFALPALAKEGSALGRWLGAGTEAAASTQNLARADMLASVLGGGIGGGLAEGPMGGLLGAAGMGAYSKFAGAGKLMGEGETYGFGKLFEGGKATKSLTKEQKLKQAEAEKASVPLTAEEKVIYNEKIKNIYNPKTKQINLKDVIDDSANGFDDVQYGKVIDEKGESILTPRAIIQKGVETPDVKIKVSRVITDSKGHFKGYAEAEEKSFGEMLEEIYGSLLKNEKGGDGKLRPYMDKWLYGVNKNGIKTKIASTNSISYITGIENTIARNLRLPKYSGSKLPVYEGYTPYVKPVKSAKPTTSSDGITTSKGEQPISNEAAAQQAAASGHTIEFLD